MCSSDLFLPQRFRDEMRLPWDAKRQKEIARQERAREKAAKRVQLKETKVKVDRNGVPEDPDIAGIVPGPQPLPYDLLDEDEPEPKP